MQKARMDQESELNASVHPGDRVGPFRLGMSLFECLNIIKTQTCASSTKTLIIFSRTNPLDKPTILDVQSLGIRLRFDAKHQKLLVVDVYDFAKVSLSFQGHLAGGKNNFNNSDSSLKTLYEILGVTHSGFRKPELGKDAFCLQYPGMLISFQIPEKEIFTGMPLILSDGTSPLANRLVVHDFTYAQNPSNGKSIRPSRMIEVFVNEDNAPQILFKEHEIGLVIGESSCQDVVSLLGPPSRTHLKMPEPIGTRARRQIDTANQENETGDYFLNYNDFGIDVLVDGSEHMVKKIILRTNLLTHPSFGQYDKCSFVLKFGEKTASLPKKNGSIPTSNSGGKGNGKKATAPSFEDLLTLPTTNPKSSYQERLVSCDENWQAIAKKLDLADEKPMVHERADQPFGPCHLFGYRHSVFEIDKISQCVASVTIF
jgi:hypothetical protein